MSPLDRLDRDERACLEEAGVPDWTAPMLATLTDDRFSDPDWLFERKLDGERALAFRKGGAVRLMTRNRKRIDDTYPEIVEALEGALDRDAVVDGEIVAFDGGRSSFARLQRRMQIKDRNEARKSPVRVWFYAFDLIHLGGHRLDRVPLRGRKKVLRAAVDWGGPIRFTPHRNRNGEAYLREACGKGWEGLIAKRASAPYRHSRSTDWLKLKCAAGQELVIGGFTAPKGARTGFGALLVGYYEKGRLRYAGKVGTGFSEDLLNELHERLQGLARKTSPFDEEVDERDVTWVRPTLVAEIGFTEWTGDGKLRHPRFLGLRDDKPAKDVHRERPQ